MRSEYYYKYEISIVHEHIYIRIHSSVISRSNHFGTFSSYAQLAPLPLKHSRTLRFYRKTCTALLRHIFPCLRRRARLSQQRSMLKEYSVFTCKLEAHSYHHHRRFIDKQAVVTQSCCQLKRCPASNKAWSFATNRYLLM